MLEFLGNLFILKKRWNGDRYRIHLNILPFVGSYTNWQRGLFTDSSVKVCSQNHNDLSNKGAHSLMINRQMPTKADDVFTFAKFA